MAGLSSQVAPWANAYAQRFKTPLERFHEKHLINPETGCWEWQAALRPGGYGVESVDGVPCHAHRVGYELLVGPIPDGLVLDHLCCNPRCVNPDHLQPVTPAENRRRQQARQTHCKHGHPLSGENLVLVRRCRICLTETEARHVAKQKAARS